MSAEHLGGDRWRVRIRRRGLSHDEVMRGTREEAEAREAALLAGMVPARGHSPTLSEWYREFRELPSNRGTPRSPATLEYYDKQMRTNVLPLLGGVEVGRITHAMVLRCVASSSAPMNTRRTLSAVLRSAYDWGWLPEPPSRRVPVHARHRERMDAWSLREAQEALRSLSGAMLAYCVLGLSGLRKCEALGLRGEDVEGGVAHVLWTYTDEGGHVPRPKNSHSERWVPLLPHPEGLLHAEGRILPMRGDVLSRRWSRALREAGLREMPPDMLRHTSDTLMLDAGMPRDMVDRIHGRSNHSTTYRHYYRPSPEEMRGALGPYFSGLGNSIPGGPAEGPLPTD